MNTLNFSVARQQALLGHLLSDSAFFLRCQVISPTWFTVMEISIIWKAAQALLEQYKRPPTHHEVIDYCSRSETPATKNKFLRAFEEAKQQTLFYKRDGLEDELTDWYKARLFHGGVHESMESFNRGAIDQAFGTIEKMASELRTANFSVGTDWAFENYLQFFADQELEHEGACTWGLDIFDRLLLPNVPEGSGSLLRGDTTILLAPTNVGKTTTMITIAVANVKKHYAQDLMRMKLGQPVRKDGVLLITHEGREADIVEKIWCCYAGMNKAELKEEILRNPSKAPHYATMAKVLKEYLVYVPMNKAGNTVEEVSGGIRNRQQKRVAENNGVGFAMMVNDYPQLLTSSTVASGQFQKRNLDEYVYNYFVQLALEYKFHALLAIQTNREGSRINKGQKGHEDRLLDYEDVHESFGPMQKATTVVTLNRDQRAEADGFITYYICKSRSNEKGWAILAKSDFSNARSHHASFGATYYRGQSTPGARCADLFRKNKGQQIHDIDAVLKDMDEADAIEAKPKAKLKAVGDKQE